MSVQAAKEVSVEGQGTVQGAGDRAGARWCSGISDGAVEMHFQGVNLT